MKFQQVLNKLLDKQDLTSDEMHDVMQLIMSGGATDAQIGGFLIALRCKGESIDEIAVPREIIFVKVCIDTLSNGFEEFLFLIAYELYSCSHFSFCSLSFFSFSFHTFEHPDTKIK